VRRIGLLHLCEGGEGKKSRGLVSFSWTTRCRRLTVARPEPRSAPHARQNLIGIRTAKARLVLGSGALLATAWASRLILQPRFFTLVFRSLGHIDWAYSPWPRRARSQWRGGMRLTIEKMLDCQSPRVCAL